MIFRSVLLCCVFLTAFLAAPVQGQATAVPTATAEPTAIANPGATSLMACGLPSGHSTFNTATTLTMTANCDPTDSYDGTSFPNYLDFTSGTSTINGGGNSITGATNGRIIRVTGSSTILNLNNVIFDNTGNSGQYLISVQNGATLNVSSVTFRNNNGRGVQVVRGEINFMNVAFRNNIGSRPAFGFIHIFRATSGTTAAVTIQNGIFTGNTGVVNVITNDSGSLSFSGCLTFSDNRQADGTTASGNWNSNTAVTDNSVGVCNNDFVTPSPTPTATGTATATATSTATDAPTSDPNLRQAPIKKPKDADARPAATPTATARPQIAATHVALQASTGATFRATFGMDSGVHFRQLDGAGIGVQAIIDAGYLEAFDVYGYVEQGVEVCFPQIGRVVFLDANTSPRAIVSLASTVVNGRTCVSIDSPGSLVLLPN